MYIPMALPTLAQYPSRIGQCEFLEIDEEELDTSSLYARLIQSPTREILLSGHSYWMKSTPAAKIDAAILLSDLNRLAPSVAKDFVPKNHAESAITFRLINDVDFHAEEDGYIALSYCWKAVSDGTPRRVVTPVGHLPFGWTKEVEQFPLPTSNALFQAVLRERREGEGLWFDQVCIDQEDEIEIATTIGAIDAIYKNARTVVVALDDIVATQEEEHFLKFYIEQYSYSELPLEQQPNAGLSPPFLYQKAPFKSFIERVLSSQWFIRAWCTHEMRMGQSHVFLVPCQTPDEDEMQRVIRFTGAFFLHMLVLAGETHTLESTLHTKVRSYQEFFHRRIQTRQERFFSIHSSDSAYTPFPFSQPPPPSLVSTIAEVFQLKAGGNPRLPEYLRRLDANRDKISIAINASSLPLALAPATQFSRPSIEDECLRTLLLVGLAARDPVTLCTTGPPLHLHDGSISWLSRPMPLDVNHSLPPPPRFTKLACPIIQASDGKAEYAQLDLIFLELPHRMQPNPHFSSHAVRARMFVDVCIQYQIQGTGLWTFWQTPNHPRASALRNVFIQTLACVFSCGAQWVCKILPTLAVSPMAPYAVETLLNPHLIIQSYVHLVEGQAALSALVNFLSTLIAAGIPWSSGASERTHGPLIVAAPSLSTSPSPSSPPPISISPARSSSISSISFPYTHTHTHIHHSQSPSPPNPVAPTTTKALIFAPFAHSKTLLIAVPAAIKDPAFSSLARGWVLTSMNPYTGSAKPTVSWTLQSKGVVFGDAEFLKRLEGVGEGDVRNHRVYGPVK